MFYEPITLEHFDRDIILNHSYIKNMTLDSKELDLSWNLRLFDLKSCMPLFFEWFEDYMKSKISVTRFFITLENRNTPVHIDGNYKTSLNIPIYNCEDNFNYWYSITDEEIKRVSEPTKRLDSHEVTYAANDGSAYLYDKRAINKTLAKLELLEPVMFNTSIPHNVVTGKLKNNKPRIVLSVRTHNMKI